MASMAAASPSADLTARTTGEGYDRPQGDQLTPLDINYKTLVEWLTGRQKLVPDWNKRLVAVQGKAADLHKELKPEMLSQLRGGSEAPLDYLRAVEVRDLLAKTAERTLFGGLTGPAGEWDKVVKAYEKGGIQLGEAALNLVQNAEYELPFLRKQAAKLRQQLEDSERRQAEYTRSAATCAMAYQQECAKLGISAIPGKVRKQLVELAQQLPQCMASTVLGPVQAPALAEAIRHYQEFVRFAQQLPADTPVLSTLREVHQGHTVPPDVGTSIAHQQQGLTTSSSSSVDTTAAVVTAAAAPAPTGISWDLDVSGPAVSGSQAAARISWDLTVEELAVGTGLGDQGGTAADEIVWDVGVVDVGAGGADKPAVGLEAAASGDINWDITFEAGEEQQQQRVKGSGALRNMEWQVGVTGDAGMAADNGAAATGSSMEGTAGPAAALEAPSGAVVARLCVDGDYRASLVDDLLELRAFLAQRWGEQSSNLLLASSMPEALQSVQGDTLASWVALAEAALGALRSERLSQLLMLAWSQRYVDRLAGALARKAGQEAKMHAAAKGVMQRGHEAKAQLVECSRKVAELVERTRALKAHAEASISTLFLNRRVIIMGDINAALASTVA